MNHLEHSNALNWRIGISDSSVNGTMAEKFKAYFENGIAYMEISRGYMDDFAQLDFEHIKELIAEYPDVSVWSVHLPFGPFDQINLASSDTDLVHRSIEYYKNCIDKAAYIGVKIAVIHPSGEPNTDKERDTLIEISSEALAKLAEYAKCKGLTIAVENIPRSCLGNCSYEMKKLISKNKDLRVCFDTNHLLIQKNVDFIRELADKIITLHISDYDFLNERHWLPYEGDNNWFEIANALEEVGYNGPWMYEINFGIQSTIQRPYLLTYEEVKENYNNCVNKIRSKPFGKQISEICLSTAYIEPDSNK